MNILVINGSPKGKNTITLHTCLFLEKKFPLHRFSYMDAVHSGVTRISLDPLIPTSTMAQASLTAVPDAVTISMPLFSPRTS